jgi:hypothetical protein
MARVPSSEFSGGNGYGGTHKNGPHYRCIQQHWKIDCARMVQSGWSVFATLRKEQDGYQLRSDFCIE